MMLDSVTLSYARIATIRPEKNLVLHDYVWVDGGHVQETSAGLLEVAIECTLATVSARDTLAEKCSQRGVKKLYFPSAMGASDDRYYNVYTSALALTPVTATLYKGSFTCTAADPYVYQTSDDTRVWG